MEDGPELPDLNNDTEYEAFYNSSIEQLDGLVDCLFDVLPTIGRLRHIWLLNLERRSKEIAAKLPTLVKVPTAEEESQNQPKSANVSSTSSSKLDESPTATYASISGPSPPMPPSGDYIDDLAYMTPAGQEEIHVVSKQKDREPSKTHKGGSPPLRRFHKDRKDQRRRTSLDPRQESMQDLLTMDLELATALRLSLIEAQEREKREDEAAMPQIREWDDEIKRLKDWSEAFEMFEKNIGSTPSESEMKKQYSIFEQLAKIGRTFGKLTSAPPSFFLAFK
jgi:hypothetical protein